MKVKITYIPEQFCSGSEASRKMAKARMIQEVTRAINRWLYSRPQEENQ